MGGGPSGVKRGKAAIQEIEDLNLAGIKIKKPGEKKTKGPKGTAEQRSKVGAEASRKLSKLKGEGIQRQKGLSLEIPSSIKANFQTTTLSLRGADLNNLYHATTTTELATLRSGLKPLGYKEVVLKGVEGPERYIHFFLSPKQWASVSHHPNVRQLPD